MMNQVLTLIARPIDTSKAVLVDRMRSDVPFFLGDGNLNLLCAHCSFVLAEGIQEGQLKNVIFLCKRCNHYNAIVP